MSLRVLWLTLVLLGPSPAFAAEPAKDCVHDRDTLLALDYDAFDQNPEGGWRPLGADPACYATAAALIAAYRDRHTASLDPGQQRILHWHEGQLRAGDGERAAAITLFEAARDDDGPAWNLYVDATLAFMRHDRDAFDRSREALAALPKPDGWDESAADMQRRFGFRPTWPMNLDVVDRMASCFDADYFAAYEGRCGRPASPR